MRGTPRAPRATGTAHKIKALAQQRLDGNPPQGISTSRGSPVSIPWPGFSFSRARAGSQCTAARVWRPVRRWTAAAGTPSPGSRRIFQASGESRKWRVPSAVCQRAIRAPTGEFRVSRSPAPQRRASFVGNGRQQGPDSIDVLRPAKRLEMVAPSATRPRWRRDLGPDRESRVEKPGTSPPCVRPGFFLVWLQNTLDPIPDRCRTLAASLAGMRVY